MADFSDNDPVGLADTASAALASVGDEDGASQAELEGMDYTKVRFVGVQFDSLETKPQIGDQMQFMVKGRVTGTGDEQMADGLVRHFAKVKVSSVVLDESEGSA